MDRALNSVVDLPVQVLAIDPGLSGLRPWSAGGTSLSCAISKPTGPWRRPFAPCST